MKATESGILLNLDCNPLFRELMKHKAFLLEWLVKFERKDNSPVVYFLDSYVLHDYLKEQQRIRSAYISATQSAYLGKKYSFSDTERTA